MKTRIVSLSLVFLFIFGIFTMSVSAASYSIGVYSVTASSGVNVRSGPSTSKAVVGAASKGVTFTVSSLSGDWGYTSSIQCTNGVKSGYVFLANCQYKSSAQTNYVTVSYNANGGTGAPKAQRVEKGKTFTIPRTIPKRDGYSFLGWGKKNSTTALASPGQSGRTSNNGTFYAVWLKGSVKTNYEWPLTSGYCYYISPACATDKVLDVNGWGKNQDTNIQLWQKGYTKNQRWQAKYYGDGYYYFIDHHSKLVLDVHGGLALNEKNISTWTKNYGDAQLFRLINAGDGYYYIQSKLNPAYYVDISGGRNANGTNVQLYQANYSNAQKFKFTPVFDVSKAIAYAKANTDKSGAYNKDPENKYNHAFNHYKSDCSNYVSQCLYAGGLNATDNWAPVYKGQNPKKVKGGIAWAAVKELFAYLKSQGFEWEEVNSNLSNIYKGDIVFLHDEENVVGHATICTGINAEKKPFYCAHSNWRKDEIYNAGIWGNKSAYVIHMSGQGT